jgi:hypothetical protein
MKQLMANGLSACARTYSILRAGRCHLQKEKVFALEANELDEQGN